MINLLTVYVRSICPYNIFTENEFEWMDPAETTTVLMLTMTETHTVSKYRLNYCVFFLLLQFKKWARTSDSPSILNNQWLHTLIVHASIQQSCKRFERRLHVSVSTNFPSKICRSYWFMQCLEVRSRSVSLYDQEILSNCHNKLTL